jgi:hypothetical protein
LAALIADPLAALNLALFAHLTDSIEPATERETPPTGPRNAQSFKGVPHSLGRSEGHSVSVMDVSEKFAAVLDLAAGMQREMQDTPESVEAVMRFAASTDLTPAEIPSELFPTAINLVANFGRLLAEEQGIELAEFWAEWRRRLGPPES